MAMRYIIRRNNAEDLSDLQKKIEGLDTLLGTPADKLRRSIPLVLNPLRTIQYLFLTRKVGTNWVWVCPSIELIAENELGLLDVAQSLGVTELPHLFVQTTSGSL